MKGIASPPRLRGGAFQRNKLPSCSSQHVSFQPSAFDPTGSELFGFIDMDSGSRYNRSLVLDA